VRKFGISLLQKRKAPEWNYENQKQRSEADYGKDDHSGAYELYEQRDKEDGHEVDDWLQAESELISVATKAAA
jgi:Protein of unknown function (DUF2934)